MRESVFDYIVIGGGSAGCVIAARLSENPSTRVLLLEAGKEGKGFLFDMPAGSFALMGNPRADWIYPTAPDPSACARVTTWAAGKALGGSSSINGMVYIRGQRGDYDAWRDSGCPGWGFDDLLPYFRKSENFTGRASMAHGSDGPLTVSPPRVLHPLAHTFLEAAGQCGMPARAEYCAGDLHGSFIVYGTTRKGKRCSARKAYLEPALDRPNLTVTTDAIVDRVLFEQRRAIGVKVIVAGERRTFTARREVVLSAGTIASPGVLLRSGIGAGADLSAMGVEIVADLPGVGRNVQEHCVVAMTSEIRTVLSNSRDAGDIVQTSTITALRGSSAQQRVSFVAGKRENAQHFGESLGLLLHAVGCGRVLLNER
ncbi:choline dehydrogenase-like flavoprotein [Paraburkholderia youngii]